MHFGVNLGIFSQNFSLSRFTSNEFILRRGDMEDLFVRIWLELKEIMNFTTINTP